MKQTFFLYLIVTLPLCVNATDVCGRTEAVKLELERELQKPCAEIVKEDLLSLRKGLVIVDNHLTELKHNDFDGLENLTVLQINNT